MENPLPTIGILLIFRGAITLITNAVQESDIKSSDIAAIFIAR
ncbi:MAG: hypothetical protein ABIG84_06415 [archaeon]